MRYVRAALLVLISVVATIFTIQNLADVEVMFLTWSFRAPRALLFAVLFLLGLLAGYLTYVLRRTFRPAHPKMNASSAANLKTPIVPAED